VLAEVEALTRAGREVVSFCIGQPDFPTPTNIGEAAIRAIKEGKTGYTPSAGIAPLREAVAAELGRGRGLDIRPEDVVVAAGCKPFIGYTIACVTDPGEGHEVVYPNPGFPIYESQIRAQGAVPVPLELRESRGFGFDAGELARLITPKTRLVILNSPQNPTGAILSHDDLDRIADAIRPHEDVWVFADEVYSRLVYDGPFQSIASRKDMLHRTIIADGASKTWAMTGWRIGFAANKTLAPHFTRWVTNTESCAGHPNQYAALAAITGPQDQAEKMKRTFKERRDLIVGLLNKVPGVTKDSEELRKLLLHEAGVAVLSDIHFGHKVPGDGEHLRFSYAASTDAIRDGLARMTDFIKKRKK